MMKGTKITKTLALFVLIAFLASCTKYVRLIETEGLTGVVKTADKSLVFENDSIKVTYFFWTDRGMMSFSVYNKLNTPIYVDWKRSGYMINGAKYNYYEQKAESENMLLANYQSGQKEALYSQKTTTLYDERISFIPPRAYVVNPKAYMLMRDDYLVMNYSTKGSKARIEAVDLRRDKTATQAKVAKTNSSGGTTTVYEKTFGEGDTPLAFRNYVTYSTSEKIETENRIDNSFYVNKISEMSEKQFHGKSTSGKVIVKVGKKSKVSNVAIYDFPYRSGNSFYIPLFW